MPIQRFAVRVCLLAVTVLGSTSVSSQDYPNKPIRIITGSPGGNGDFTARLVAQGLSSNVGQPVIVDNRSGLAPGETISKAPPDGYALLVDGGTFWIAPLLEKVPYDVVKDFSPVTLLVRVANVVVVHPSLPVKSVKELIALAKARPGELNYASGGTGGANHIAAELFASMADVKITRVNYKGGGPAVIGLLSGEVQMMFINVPAVATHLKSGRLKALAVTTAQPTELAPGLPTVAASGVPGYEAVTMLALFAPAKTPEAVINRLNQEVVRVLSGGELKQKLFSVGSEPTSSTPEQTGMTIRSEIAKWAKVLKTTGS